MVRLIYNLASNLKLSALWLGRLLTIGLGYVLSWREARLRTPSAVARLTRRFINTRYPSLRSYVKRKLGELNDSAAIDRVWQVWEQTRSPILAEFLTKQGWFATAPLRLRLLSALLLDRPAALDLSRLDELDELIELGRQEDDLILARRASQWLNNLTERATFEALYHHWQTDQRPGLAELSGWADFMDGQPAALRVLIALAYPRPALLTPAEAEVITPLLRLAKQTRETTNIEGGTRQVWQARLTFQEGLPERAWQTLSALEEGEGRDELCRQALDRQASLAREVALANDYYPRDSYSRALFFFLTEQWQRYEELDWDSSLLRLAYETADEQVRGWVWRLAREAGRAELIRVLADNSGGRALVGKRLTALSQAEWQIILELLTKGERWSQAFELAQVAPPRWSVQLLRRLATAHWQPDNLTQREILAQLSAQAQECEVDGPPLGRQARVLKNVGTHLAGVARLVASPQDRLFATAHTDGSIYLWDLATENFLWQWRDELAQHGLEASRPYAHTYQVTNLAFSEDGQTLLVEDGWKLPNDLLKWQARVRFFNLAGQPRSNREINYTVTTSEGVHSAFSFKRNLYAVFDQHFIDLSDLETDKVVRQIKPNEWSYYSWAQPTLKQLLFSPSGDSLLTHLSPRGWRITLFNTHNSNNTTEMQHIGGRPITAVAFSPDEQMIAVADELTHIRLRRLPGGGEIETLHGHNHGCYTLAFSPDGNTLASGHRDVVRLWDVRTQRPVKTLRGHRGEVRGLTFTTDGTRLISGDATGRIKVWSSRLIELADQPTATSRLENLLAVRQAQRDPALPPNERHWLAFVENGLGRHWQNEIELEDAPALPIRFDDIEIE